MPKAGAFEELLSLDLGEDEKEKDNDSAFEELLSLDLTETNRELVAKGEMTLEQDERDIEEAGGRKFIPDTPESEKAPELGALTASGMNTLDKATFGLSTRAAAKLGDISKEEAEQEIEKGLAGQFGADTASTIIGYALNPVGRVVQGAVAARYGVRGVKTLMASNVAEALAVEGVESIADLTSLAIENKGFTKEALKKEGWDIAREGAGAVAGTLLFAGLAAPVKMAGKTIGKPLAKTYGAIAKKFMGESAEKTILENAEALSKVDPKQVPKQVAEVFDEAQKGLRQYLEEGRFGNSQLGMETAEELSKRIDEHVGEMIQTSLEKPEAAVNSLVKFVDELELGHGQASQVYGAGLDKLAKLTGDKKVDMSEAVDALIEVFKREGSLDEVGGKLKVTGFQSRFNDALRIIDDISKNREMTHKQINTICSKIEDAFEEGTSSESVVNQAKYATKLFKEKIGDPKIWGEEAVNLTASLNDDYSAARGAFKALKSGKNKIKNALAGISKNPESFLGQIDDIAKGMKKMKGAALTLEGMTEYSSKMPQGLQQKIKANFGETKKLLRYKDAADVGRAKTSLDKIINGKSGKMTTRNETIREALRKYANYEDVMDLVRLSNKGMPEIQRALDFPFEKSSRKAAVEWAEQYADRLPSEISKLVDASAKWQRLAKLKPGEMTPKKAVEALREVAPVNEILGFNLFQNMSDGAKLIQKNQKAVEIFMEEGKDLIKIATKPGIQEEEVAVGLVAQMSKSAGAALATGLAIFRLLGKPGSVNVAMEKLASAGFNRAQIMTIVGGARTARVLGDEMYNMFGDTYEDGMGEDSNGN